VPGRRPRFAVPTAGAASRIRAVRPVSGTAAPFGFCMAAILLERREQRLEIIGRRRGVEAELRYGPCPGSLLRPSLLEQLVELVKHVRHAGCGSELSDPPPSL
jgi:hypothetical protein